MLDGNGRTRGSTETGRVFSASRLLLLATLLLLVACGQTPGETPPEEDEVAVVTGSISLPTGHGLDISSQELKLALEPFEKIRKAVGDQMACAAQRASHAAFPTP